MDDDDDDDDDADDDDDECRAVGEMSGRGNRSTRRKPATVPFCPPQTPHDLNLGSKPGTTGEYLLYTAGGWLV
jgi:hypothetical protein